MHEPAPPSIRTRSASGTSEEIAWAKAQYLRRLRDRVRDGTYFTRERVDRALDRLLAQVREDLPQDPID
jgi:hypothetical protein